MQKVKIITDSASDLPKEFFDKYNISMLPMGVVIGERTYLDRVELSTGAFFDMMRQNAGELPKTAMPAPETIEAEFRRNLDAFERQIYVCISSKGSGTFGVANVMKAQLEEELGRESNITIIDSQSYSAGYGIVVAEMARLAWEGASYEAVMDAYRSLSEKTDVLLVIDDLKHLQRGGRIKPTAAIVGGMLGIKPLLTINDGLLESFGKERGKKRGLEKLLELMLANIGDPARTRIWLVHANAVQDMELLRAMITDRISPQEIVVVELGACIGVHTGEGLVGVVYNKK